MNIQERYALLLDELMNGIDNGDFADVGQIPEKYTFEYLNAVQFYAEQLDGGRDFYKQLFTVACQAGDLAVREKVEKGEKIKVTFLAISAAEWPTDRLYRMLDKDPQFDVSVTNCPLVDRSFEDRSRTYLQNKKFFEEQGYHVLDTYSVEQDKVYSWEELKQVPDVVIHVSFWYESMPPCFRISNYPLHIMNFYIHYGYATGNSVNGKYVDNVEYNKDVVNLARRVYINTKLDLYGFRQHQLLEGSNVVYSGYTKMDCFYEKVQADEGTLRKLWNIPSNVDVEKMKRVIIAPHHSFLGYCGIIFSTFAQNVYFWLYLAEKYKDQISFVFKPHPNLRYRAIEAKIFANGEEWDAYLEKWKALPNAKVVEEQSYLEFFETADAIIYGFYFFYCRMAVYGTTGPISHAEGAGVL